MASNPNREFLETVYLETSIVSYATAKISRDLVTAAMQKQARDWWANIRPSYDLVTSQLTLDEAVAGDPAAAALRLQLLEGLPLLAITPDAAKLASRLVEAHAMPRKAMTDALHIAVAAIGGARYLLTLNCKHIANARELPRIYEIMDNEGLGPLLICTPAEFLGGQPDDERKTDS